MKRRYHIHTRPDGTKTHIRLAPASAGVFTQTLLEMLNETEGRYKPLVDRLRAINPMYLFFLPTEAKDRYHAVMDKANELEQQGLNPMDDVAFKDMFSELLTTPSFRYCRNHMFNQKATLTPGPRVPKEPNPAP